MKTQIKASMENIVDLNLKIKKYKILVNKVLSN